MADEEENGRSKSYGSYNDYSNEKPIYQKVFFQREDDTPSLDVRESTFSKQPSERSAKLDTSPNKRVDSNTPKNYKKLFQLFSAHNL
jgi:hypothetical protein